MTAAFLLYDNLVALDLVGAYDPITRLGSMDVIDGFAWDLCALDGPVTDDRGLRLTPDRVGTSLGEYDLLVVPGGHGTRRLRRDEAFLNWLGTAAPVPLKVSVCTGALLLGAMGVLEGRRATTHPNAVDDLAPDCAEVVGDRVVDEGPVVTARGVSAGIAEQMDYPYGPAAQ